MREEAERRVDQVMLLLKVITIGAWIVFAVALAGELLGWWEAAGEVALMAASLLGAAGTLALALYGASRGRVRSVGANVHGNTRQLDLANATLLSMKVQLERLGTLDAMDVKLGKLDAMDAKLGKLDAMDAKLGTLDTMNVKLDRLDAIQLRLDQQTGVLGDQLAVLHAIRDRLPGG